jgi:hypothetical protein
MRRCCGLIKGGRAARVRGSWMWQERGGWLSSAAEDGGETEGEVDAETVELDLAESHVAGGDLDIRGYQHREAVADSGLDAHRQIEGREKFVGLTGVGKSFCVGSVVKVIIVITVFVGEQVGRGADAGKKESASGGTEVIPEVQGDLKHIESSFYIVNGGGSAHPHSVVLVVVGGDVIVLWGSGKNFSGEQQS